MALEILVLPNKPNKRNAHINILMPTTGEGYEDNFLGLQSFRFHAQINAIQFFCKLCHTSPVNSHYGCAEAGN